MDRVKNLLFPLFDATEPISKPHPRYHRVGIPGRLLPRRYVQIIRVLLPQLVSAALYLLRAATSQSDVIRMRTPWMDGNINYSLSQGRPPLRLLRSQTRPTALRWNPFDMTSLYLSNRIILICSECYRSIAHRQFQNAFI
jgi:hypothetical protein